jgi:hypothetical protein
MGCGSGAGIDVSIGPFKYTCETCGKDATKLISRRASWRYLLKRYGLVGMFLYGLTPGNLTRVTGTCDEHFEGIRSGIEKKEIYNIKPVE